MLAMLAMLAMLLTPAHAADDGDRALDGFTKADATAARQGPGDPLDWQRRLRSADSLGPTPLREADRTLLAAARNGRWADALAELKRGGGSVHAQDTLGRPLLALAAGAGEDEVVRALLKRGADIDATGDQGLTPLAVAALAGRRSTVRLLLRAGADPAR
jgi:hypothetical protein